MQKSWVCPSQSFAHSEGPVKSNVFYFLLIHDMMQRNVELINISEELRPHLLCVVSCFLILHFQQQLNKETDTMTHSTVKMLQKIDCG